MNEPIQFDYAIVGGGIVGLATAMEFMQVRSDAKLLLLEKEVGFGQHQSGHNSGVVHAGVYYKTGSRKAEFCVAGAQATSRFCARYNVPHEQCGKLIVATDEVERRRLLALYRQGRDNGLDLELLDGSELARREPNIRGVGAIYSSTTSIVDYPQMCTRMAERVSGLGGQLWLGARVSAMRECDRYVTIACADGRVVRSKFLIVCSGLQADRTASMMGLAIDFRIVPYRGEYFRLPDSLSNIVKHLIYPVPDPDLPFLGVHLTRTIDGAVTVGPNAVQGWKREGYGRMNVNARDIANMFAFGGYWRATIANMGPGLNELRNSLWKRGYLKQIQKYCPSLKLDDLGPYPAGVRAQAVLRSGALIDDFLFVQSTRSLHVCNAPSPAATAAIPIGKYIVEKVMKRSAR